MAGPGVGATKAEVLGIGAGKVPVGAGGGTGTVPGPGGLDGWLTAGDVTVVVSGVILYQFGTGPVKGFAVTLMIGIVASLFTAVFFTRLVFDLIYMGRRRLQTLSI